MLTTNTNLKNLISRLVLSTILITSLYTIFALESEKEENFNLRIGNNCLSENIKSI